MDVLTERVLMLIVISTTIGVFAEIAAYGFKFWIYRKPYYPVINVLLMFGLLMGIIGLAVPTVGWVPVFIGATLIGYGYEKVNFSHLHWWDFPNDQFLFFKGKNACAWAVGFLWGSVPVGAYFVNTVIWK